MIQNVKQFLQGCPLFCWQFLLWQVHCFMAQTTFTPKESEATVDVVFEFNGSSLKGKNTVIYESITQDEAAVGYQKLQEFIIEKSDIEIDSLMGFVRSMGISRHGYRFRGSGWITQWCRERTMSITCRQIRILLCRMRCSFL